MSTFSGLLVSMTGALAHDVYGRMLRPKSTPEQRMRMFKFAAVLIGGVSILLGSLVEPLEINFMVGQAFAIAAASYFPLLFMSVWWRGMTMKRRGHRHVDRRPVRARRRDVDQRRARSPSTKARWAKSSPASRA
jgi:Na+(H+)/acetate symporter ActP